jgi:hypothetical protein
MNQYGEKKQKSIDNVSMTHDCTPYHLIFIIMYRYTIFCWFLLFIHHSALALRDNCSSLPSSLYSPLNQTGPRLTVSHKKLFNALKCYPNLNKTIENQQKRRWILLIPGTSEHVEELFGWNWISVFDYLQWPYCTVQLPHRGMADLQIAAEYVVYALRYMSKQTKQEQRGKGFKITIS